MNTAQLRNWQQASQDAILSWLQTAVVYARNWWRTPEGTVLQRIRLRDTSINDWLTPSDVPERPGTRAPARVGMTVVLVLFGGFGLWAGLAPIESAAIAPGQIRVESYRKTVQHLEGGIVREILVSESSHVDAGQVLMRLDTMESNTALTVLEDQDNILSAQLTRLVAERDGAETLVFAAALEAMRASNPRVAEAIATQQKTFAARKSSLASETSIFQEQINQLEAQIPGYKSQLVALESQIKSLTAEIKDVSTLLLTGLATRPRLQALQRDLAGTQGEKGRQLSAIASAKQAIAEAQFRISDAQNRRADSIQEELRDTQSKLAEIGEKKKLASDINARKVVTAPVTGRVVGMRIFTTGGVIRAGEPILDVVPDVDVRLIEARVSPSDIDVVRVGLPARVMLSAYRSRVTPLLNATVTDLSPDALTSEDGRITYYTADVLIDPAEIAKLTRKVELYPGMPVEVMIVTGKSTMLDYLLQPLTDSFNRAFREQ